jgi:LCP family protein required for cell wall assembly
MSSPGEGAGSAQIACLLPVRNGASNLPGWFESVARFADVVVALDDGSTDDTRALLERHELVVRTLVNPPRPSHAGWDDARNRQRLLDAAVELEPKWVMALDVDERITADDARALRRFTERDALPGFAYGFRVFRMICDEQHFDRADLWVYRLFAFEPGATLPAARLHLVPVPVSIPRNRWLRTTLRIQHLASLDEPRRQARFRKYEEADTAGRYQADYSHLLDRPGALHVWTPRPPDAPVLEGAPNRPADDPASLDDPVLSAIVIAQDDEAVIETVVSSVVGQEVPEAFEVIVVTSGRDGTAAIVRERFPGVRVVELPEPAPPGMARNAGLAVARGDYVSFPGSHVVLRPGSLAARLRAHQAGWAMVTGTTLNGTDTAAGWASYFLDHASVLPGRPSEEIAGPPAHCSYMRHLLEGVGGFPEDRRSGEDTVVNVELFRRGHRAYRARDVVLVHRTPCRTAPALVRHHFQRGRGYGRILLEDAGHGGRILTRRTRRRLLIEYLPHRLDGIRTSVDAWGGELVDAYERVHGLVAVGAVAAWCGLWAELVRPARGKLRLLLGTRGRTLLLVGLDRRAGEHGGRADALLLVRLDLVRPAIRLVSLPRDLLVDDADGARVRLNEVYHRAGPARGRSGHRLLALRSAVARATDVAVDGALAVDMAGFPALVDAIGGIDIEVDEPIDDPLADEGAGYVSATFASGAHRVHGDHALAFARTRADGDEQRRRRHLQLVTNLIEATRARRPLAAWPGVLRRLTGSTERRLGAAVLGSLVLNGRLRRAPVASTLIGAPVVSMIRAGDRWVQVADPGRLRDAVADGLGLGRTRAVYDA